MDSKTEKFKYYLDECYFHPERDKKYPSEAVRKLARKAMEMLWDKSEITVEGITYTNEQIQRKLIDEMMPEILDRAVEVYLQAKNVKCESAYLSSCIFRTLINYDAYIERLFNQTFYK